MSAFTASEKAGLKRGLDATEESTKRLCSAAQDIMEKLGQLEEITTQSARDNGEILTRLEDLEAILASFKEVLAANRGTATASSGPGKTGGELSFSTFVENVVASLTLKAAVVQLALEDSFCISSDKPKLVVVLHQQYLKKAGVDKRDFTPVEAASAASWAAVGSIATALATKRRDVKNFCTSVCLFFQALL
jgi:hypothetical protein